MCSEWVRIILVPQGVPVGVSLPPNAFQITNQLLALRINQQAMVASMVAQHGVHAVRPIFHQGIAIEHTDASVKEVRVTLEELTHDLPIGVLGRGVASLAGSVTIHINIQRPGLKLSLDLVRSSASLADEWP